MIPDKITLTFPDNYDAFSKVDVIKAIRSLSGYGLKEAKELSEQRGPVDLNIVMIVGLNDTSHALSFRNGVNLLKANGVTVVANSLREGLIKDIRNLTSMAVLKGEVDIAKVLIEALEKVDTLAV